MYDINMVQTDLDSETYHIFILLVSSAVKSRVLEIA
jgi:hypothetical protein